jgi:hypothetical protein
MSVDERIPDLRRLGCLGPFIAMSGRWLNVANDVPYSRVRKGVRKVTHKPCR